ncbi:hypothetical protein LJC74_05150 [Eubacteriales bacterium OttesenSCG-928-A19]|nr:hypothetical protein [Eubacteriales bacterium OttesenSCG-928-A19]
MRLEQIGKTRTGQPRGGKFDPPSRTIWKHSIIVQILALEEYCGDVINFKTYSKSYKNKARINNNRDACDKTHYVRVDFLEQVVMGEIKRLYVDNVSGKISDDRFSKMSSKYEDEQKELMEKIAELSAMMECKTAKRSVPIVFSPLFESIRGQGNSRFNCSMH